MYYQWVVAAGSPVELPPARISNSAEEATATFATKGISVLSFNFCYMTELRFHVKIVI